MVEQKGKMVGEAGGTLLADRLIKVIEAKTPPPPPVSCQSYEARPSLPAVKIGGSASSQQGRFREPSRIQRVSSISSQIQTALIAAAQSTP
jgi:hypothetical protein